MIVADLDVICVAVNEPKADTPLIVHFAGPQLGRVTLTVIKNVSPNPAQVRFFGAPTELPRAASITDLSEESWFL